MPERALSVSRHISERNDIKPLGLPSVNGELANSAGRDRLQRQRADSGDAKGRYKIMEQLHAEGRQIRPRHDVPDLHGADQSHFSSEADMVKKLASRCAAAGRDRAVRQFAVHRGQAQRLMSFRSEIWRDTDNARSGMLPWAFESGMGFERWVGLRARRSHVFRQARRGVYRRRGLLLPRFLPRQESASAGRAPDLVDWANHLSTIFPEVRLKRYLEMRGADGGPWGRLPALPAFWVGLLYDDVSLDAAWDLVKHWTAQERQAAARRRPALRLQGPDQGPLSVRDRQGMPRAGAVGLAATGQGRS